jgi:hypothetical protein
MRAPPPTNPPQKNHPNFNKIKYGQPSRRQSTPGKIKKTTTKIKLRNKQHHTKNLSLK